VHPFFASLTPPLHISHRGGSALAPENTMVAFRAAVEQHRTDMLELDVHATSDGELVVFHDPTLERCTDGQGPIDALSWAQLSRLDAAFHFVDPGGRPARGQAVRVPRFTELLDAFPTLRLNVEVKSQRALEPFVELLRRRPGDLRRLCLGSEHDAIAAALAAALPGACLFYPANALAAFVISARSGEAVERDPRYHVLDMPVEWEGVTVFDEQVVAAARDGQVWVNVWTIDDPAVMRRLIAQGVGGIMTDRPDLLRQVLDGAPPRS